MSINTYHIYLLVLIVYLVILGKAKGSVKGWLFLLGGFYWVIGSSIVGWYGLITADRNVPRLLRSLFRLLLLPINSVDPYWSITWESLRVPYAFGLIQVLFTAALGVCMVIKGIRVLQKDIPEKEKPEAS